MDEKYIIEQIKSLLSDRKYGNESFEFLIESRLDTYKPDLIIKAGRKNIAAIEINFFILFYFFD